MPCSRPVSRWSAVVLRSAVAALGISLAAPVGAGESGVLEDAMAAALSLSTPATDALDIYIGTDSDDLSVQSSQVSKAGETLTRLEVGGRAAEALHRGGMMRLRIPCSSPARVCGPSGADATPRQGEPLVVELLARRTDAAMSSTLVRLTYAIPTGAGRDAPPLQLMLTRDGVLRRHVLRPREGDVSEPKLTYAQWLLDSGDAFGAAVVLAQMKAVSDQAALLARRQELQERIRAAIDAQQQINPAPAPEGSAHALLTTAEKHLDSSHPERATPVLEAIIARDGAIALRDVSHLLLARLALRSGRVETAREHYQSIISPGPFSSQALLELGWSYLLPARSGTQGDATSRMLLAPTSLPLRAASPEALAELRRETPFRSYAGVARSERAADLATSVRIWQELIGRDPLDLAVQEGQLALAYAFEHMGDHQRALQHYKRSVAVLARGHALLGSAIAHARSGQLVEAIAQGTASPGVYWPWWTVERRASRWWIGNYRPPPALFYAHYLVAERDFVAAAERLQLLYAMHSRLRATAESAVTEAARADPILQRLAPVLREAEAAIERHAIAWLKERRTRVESLLAEAHFAIARMHEPDAFPQAAAVPVGDETS